MADSAALEEKDVPMEDVTEVDEDELLGTKAKNGEELDESMKEIKLEGEAAAAVATESTTTDGAGGEEKRRRKKRSKRMMMMMMEGLPVTLSSPQRMTELVQLVVSKSKIYMDLKFNGN